MNSDVVKYLLVLVLSALVSPIPNELDQQSMDKSLQLTKVSLRISARRTSLSVHLLPRLSVAQIPNFLHRLHH